MTKNDTADGTESKTFKVSAVQWAPEFHDLSAGVEKAVRAIAEAAAGGSRLVVFPEVWLQGYVYWASMTTREPAFFAWQNKLREVAVQIPGPEVERIAAAAAEHGINVVISMHERGGESIYNTQIYLSAQGELLGAHRKLIPTAIERLVWGNGDGSDLDAYRTSAGRIGGLLCFEHHMAPARFLMAQLGVQVHVSPWPGFAMLDGIVDANTRQLAFENGCFVIVAREIMSADRLGPGLPDPGDDPGRWAAHGGSAIIAPDGSYLVAPLFDEERIITAAIDLREIGGVKSMFDTVGHYSRPDVFQLVWHRQPKNNVLIADDEEE
jgi:predicted amidohydrolase